MMTNKGALAGLRVLDLSRVLAGPWTAQILGDLGAEVIKVERPGRGDEARSYGLATRSADGRRTPAPMHLVANRNKRSITIDISKPEGAALVSELVQTCDILVENFLPGKLARFGLDYESMHGANPGLIYCSITGYGQSGPLADRPGYDAVFQAHGGLMSVTGLPDGVPGGGPMKTGPSLVDVATGYVAVVGILAALVHRHKTGEGQHVDTSLLDTVIGLQSSLIQTYLISRDLPERKGTSGNGGHPAQVFRCADGDLYISAGHQKHYEALCGVLDLAELVSDTRFADNRLRFINRAQWNDEAGPAIARWEKRRLLDALAEANVPAALVNNYEEVFSDPHVKSREIEIDMTNPLDPAGRISTIASAIRLSETPASYRLPPPELGEHSDEILRELLGMPDDRIAALRQGGVI
jgi:crotonobetainyl-CoA:carnitine CoA-transferase CaiB-like acyl-CoA transferase